MKRIIVAALAIVLAAACTENKKAEQTYPIGDRAFYEVAGNVECVDLEDVYQEFIFLGQKPEFNKEGQFFVNGIKYKEEKEGDLRVLKLDTDDEDGGGEEYVECKYDTKGRLVSAGFWESSFSDIKYDDQDRVVSFSAYGMMGIESEYHYTFTYGKVP